LNVISFIYSLTHLRLRVEEGAMIAQLIERSHVMLGLVGLIPAHVM